jgi:plasmid replication initiation protein
VVKNKSIVKANQVIEASYHLSAIEQRLILSAISRIPRGGKVTDDTVYLVSVKDMERLGAHKTTAYRDLKEALSRLYERSINIRADNQSVKMRWVQSIRFMDTQSVIGLRFTKEILPFLSNINREFTKYALSDIAGMSSAYAIRIYELLAQYRNIGKREISLDELRYILELGTRYRLFGDLKRWVIDTAVTEINCHSSLQVAYEVRKSGRKISHVIFSFMVKERQKVTKRKPKKSLRSRLKQSGVTL